MFKDLKKLGYVIWVCCYWLLAKSNWRCMTYIGKSCIFQLVSGNCTFGDKFRQSNCSWKTWTTFKIQMLPTRPRTPSFVSVDFTIDILIKFIITYTLNLSSLSKPCTTVICACFDISNAIKRILPIPSVCERYWWYIFQEEMLVSVRMSHLVYTHMTHVPVYISSQCMWNSTKHIDLVLFMIDILNMVLWLVHTTNMSHILLCNYLIII
jgi:hypothetical protein